jgi:hypothetical protein
MTPVLLYIQNFIFQSILLVRTIASAIAQGFLFTAFTTYLVLAFGLIAAFIKPHWSPKLSSVAFTYVILLFRNHR